jgi:hypothetical protein
MADSSPTSGLSPARAVPSSSSENSDEQVSSNSSTNNKNESGGGNEDDLDNSACELTKNFERAKNHK